MLVKPKLDVRVGATIEMEVKCYWWKRGLSYERLLQFTYMEEIDDYVSEDVEAVVPYRGSAQELLKQLVGGLQSSMSYSSAHSIDELYN